MPARQRGRVPCSLAALALTSSVAAAEPWFTFKGAPHCSADPSALAERLSVAVAGGRDPELDVEIEIGGGRARTIARVRLARGPIQLGQKHIAAERCDDALDTAVAVAALALGAMPPRPALVQPPGDPGRAATRGSPALGETGASDALPTFPDARTSSLEPGLADVDSRDPVMDATDSSEMPPPREAAPSDAPVSREGGAPPLESRGLYAFWSVGVDDGALGAPTPLLDLGLRGGSGPYELRAHLAYGLPLVSEQEETGIGLERSRADFAALALDACRALDAAGWLSLCAGLEARVTRSLDVDAPSDERASSRRRLAAGAFAVAGASFVYRAAAWQPRLDLSAPASLIGGAAGADRLGVRALLGARLPF